VRYLTLATALFVTCFLSLNFAAGHDSKEDQPPAVTAEENSADLKPLANQAVSAGHNARMMTSCALVLFMTAPGLALFYSGLVRRKNVLSVMMQCIFLMGLMTIAWCLWGYSLCFGWFGFNAGSGLAADGLAASAFAATHFSAAAGALTWPAIEWIKRGKPTVLGTCSGAIAGLACITPAAGYVSPLSAVLIGLLASICCYYACTTLKTRLGYDDSLDVFGIPGIGGTLGILLTGIFATRAVNDVHGNGVPVGFIDGGGFSLLGTPLIVVIISYIFTIVVTLILLKILDATMGRRVTQAGEIAGLDLSQHVKEGYITL